MSAPGNVVVEPQSSWKPTRKWVGALVIGLLTIGAHAIASGGVDTTEYGEVMTLLISLAGAYFVTNEPTPGGVPAE